MRLLGIIPARAGSKRLPNKNVADLGGKPLIAWSIEVGLKTCSAGVVVSTDGHAIEDIAKQRGALVIRRPSNLATDSASTEVVVAHAVSLHVPETFDAVLVLQPTSPFRTAEDVAQASVVMQKNDADSVISVVKLVERDALFRLGWGGRMRPAETADSPIYAPNGAIYLIKREHLDSDWYGEGAYAYIMPPERSLDIDTHSDLDAARALLGDR